MFKNKQRISLGIDILKFEKIRFAKCKYKEFRVQTKLNINNKVAKNTSEIL